VPERNPKRVQRQNGYLSRNTWAKCDQVTSLEEAHLLYPPFDRLMDDTLQSIEQSIKLALQLL
jgi:hypothetical protein